MGPRENEVRRLLAELEGVTLEATPDGFELRAVDVAVEGREKFSRRRKLRRLRRLVTEADRQGPLSSLVESRDPVIRVRAGTDSAAVVIDRRAVEITFEDAAILVHAGDITERYELPFTPTTASRTVSNGITTVDIT